VIYETQADLDAALAYWQKVLRLQDWTIKARIVTRKEMPDYWFGWSQVQNNLKTCFIRLIHPEHRDHEDLAPENELDHEQSLVHELLHAHFHNTRPEDGKSLAYELWEQTIDTLATAFVNLKRSGLQPTT